MIAERINDELVIRIPSSIDIEDVQRLIDLINLKEATAQSVAKQEDIDSLVQEVKKGWWAANRSRFINS